jgi:hypothetical protein
VHLTLADVLREGAPFERCDRLHEIASRVRALGEPAANPDLDEVRALDCLRATT